MFYLYGSVCGFVCPEFGIACYTLVNFPSFWRCCVKSGAVVVIVMVIIGAICCTVAACGLLIAFGWVERQSGDFDFGTLPQTGELARDFELKTIDGEVVSLHQFRGQPVMLNFWALWCGPCIDEMPLIQERYRQHNPDLVVLSIEEGTSAVSVGNYVHEAQLSFPVLTGADDVGRQFNIRAYPTSIFIDADGVIQSIVIGSLSSSGLDAELAKIGVGD